MHRDQNDSSGQMGPALQWETGSQIRANEQHLFENHDNHFLTLSFKEKDNLNDNYNAQLINNHNAGIMFNLDLHVFVPHLFPCKIRYACQFFAFTKKLRFEIKYSFSLSITLSPNS